MQISQVPMTRNHFSSGSPQRIRMVVLHATAGSYPGDFEWLRKGGDPKRPVSVHYYITKSGAITQFLPDGQIAWHAGASRWPVDGHLLNGCNTASVGIELENRNNGRDPYPEAQYAAALWLTRGLVRQYHIPPNQLVRHLDISPGRKTDPAGFPWERFVAEVYHTQYEVLDAKGNTKRLREIMLAQAYLAAGGAVPAEWPLRDAALRLELGMPALVIHKQHALGNGRMPAAAAQDDLDRPVQIAGRSLVVEAFARDLLFVDAHRLDDQPGRLSELPNGALRDGLLQIMFRAADPLNGFTPSWSMHQYYLDHRAELGVPIGPNHRLVPTLANKRAFSCQHFSLDSLISPVNQWQVVFRLSELVRAFVLGSAAPPSYADPNTLRQVMELVLNDLYLSQAGRHYAPRALFSSLALRRQLGAPLGPPTPTRVGNEAFIIMPFACNILACHVPPDWSIDQPLPEVSAIALFSELHPTTPSVLGSMISQLGLGRTNWPPRATDPALSGRPGEHLLGSGASLPPIVDLSPLNSHGDARLSGLPDRVVVYRAEGPAALDLQAMSQPYATFWHYYLDLRGNVTRLIPERYAARAAVARRLQSGEDLDQVSLAIAVEGGVRDQMPTSQRRALRWLVSQLCHRLAIDPEAVFLADDPSALADRVQRTVQPKNQPRPEPQGAKR